MSQKPRYTILRKLLLFLLPFVMLAIIATAIILTWTNYNSFRKTIHQDYTNIINSSAGEIRLFVTNALSALDSLADIISATKLDTWQKQMALIAFNLNQKKFISVSLFSSDLQPVVSTGWTTPQLTGDDKNVVETVLNGSNAVSNVKLMAKDRLPFVQMAVPVKYLGKVKEVLWGELNLKSVWDLLEGINIGHSGQIFLMDLSGNYIAHREIERVMLPAPANNPQIIKLIRTAQKPVNWNAKEDGTRYFFLGAIIPDLGWIIILRQPLTEIYNHFYRNILWAAIITILGCLLAIWLGVPRVKRFVAPVQQLHGQVLKMSQGEIDQKVVVTSQDEIGDLGHAFNQMTDSLKTHIDNEIKTAIKLAHAENLALIGTASSKLNHEVGNLINNVTLAIRSLRAENLSTTGATSLDILKNESDRVKAFIHKLLQFAKPPQLNLVKSDLEQIIFEVVAAHKSAATAQDILFELDWPKTLPKVPIDIVLIYHAINNMVKNSLEAMTQSGTICISGQLENHHLIVHIADNGPGIETAILDKIFKPFYTTKGRQGTGLGMAIVKSTITAHRGTIHCQSTPGTGTTFILRLPLQ
jgi:signal transduction histidine kinase